LLRSARNDSWSWRNLIGNPRQVAAAVLRPFSR
jgi:hypothetical protein